MILLDARHQSHKFRTNHLMSKRSCRNNPLNKIRLKVFKKKIYKPCFDVLLFAQKA